MWRHRRIEKPIIFYLMVGAGAGLFVIDVLLFFFSIGGLLVLSLLDDERFAGSAFSMSCTFRLMYWASGQCLATLCNNAVVDDVLNRPNARRRNPWLKHASTAAHNEVTEPDSSWTNFRVTASSMICFTSFLTAAISRSLKSIASAKHKMEKLEQNWKTRRNRAYGQIPESLDQNLLTVPESIYTIVPEYTFCLCIDFDQTPSWPI